MPFDESKPLIAAAFVCEKVLSEGNIHSAIRIVDKFTLTIAPVAAVSTPVQTSKEPAGEGQVLNLVPVFDMTAFVMLRAGKVTGKHELSIVVRNPDGEERRFPDKTVEFTLGDPAEAAVVSIKLLMPNNAKRGRYWIDVLWDGEALTRIPVSLLEGAAEAPAIQGGAQHQQ